MELLDRIREKFRSNHKHSENEPFDWKKVEEKISLYKDLKNAGDLSVEFNKTSKEFQKEMNRIAEDCLKNHPLRPDKLADCD